MPPSEPTEARKWPDGRSLSDPRSHAAPGLPDSPQSVGAGGGREAATATRLPAKNRRNPAAAAERSTCTSSPGPWDGAQFYHVATSRDGIRWRDRGRMIATPFAAVGTRSGRGRIRHERLLFFDGDENPRESAAIGVGVHR